MNALVTGASSGIGKEIALLLAERGYHIVLVARREKELNELAEQLSYGATVIAQDLGAPGAAKALFDAVRQKELDIEVLVNNAGFGRAEEHLATDIDTLESMNHLNITCLASLCRLFGEPMKSRGHGAILNVGSTAAYLPIPYMANYAASKAFVSSFTRAFRFEMAPHGVQVSLLSPGATVTEFGLRAQNEGDFLKNKPGLMSAKEVAAAGLEALFADVGEAVPGWMNKAMIIVLKFVPAPVVVRLASMWAKDH
jgi:short-subunit dehydrogenase